MASCVSVGLLRAAAAWAIFCYFSSEEDDGVERARIEKEGLSERRVGSLMWAEAARARPGGRENRDLGGQAAARGAGAGAESVLERTAGARVSLGITPD